MCVAIFSPASAPAVSRATLETCRANNPDGHGLAWSEHGRLHVAKSLGKFGKFARRYARNHARGLSQIVHFRIATSGKIDARNTHPHAVNAEVVAIHNGVLSGLGNDVDSDTVEFCAMLAKLAVDSWFGKLETLPLLEYATRGSKFVFLHRDGRHFIVNESAGIWENGVWFSNDSFRKLSCLAALYENDIDLAVWPMHARARPVTHAQRYDYDGTTGYVAPAHTRMRSLHDTAMASEVIEVDGAPYCPTCLPEYDAHVVVQSVASDYPVFCAACGAVANQFAHGEVANHSQSADDRYGDLWG